MILFMYVIKLRSNSTYGSSLVVVAAPSSSLSDNPRSLLTTSLKLIISQCTSPKLINAYANNFTGSFMSRCLIHLFEYLAIGMVLKPQLGQRFVWWTFFCIISSCCCSVVNVPDYVIDCDDQNRMRQCSSHKRDKQRCFISWFRCLLNVFLCIKI